MRTPSTDYATKTTNDDSRSDSDEIATSQTDSELSDWFGQLARPLLSGTDAGYSLHLATGFLPGTCARYVAKSAASRRQPPGYFIVSLLRSEQGATWLAAFMDGYEPRWWRERVILQNHAELFLQIAAIVGKKQCGT